MYSLSSEVHQLTRPFSVFDKYFLQAQRVRSLVRRDFDCIFRAPNVLSAHPETNVAGVDVLGAGLVAEY